MDRDLRHGVQAQCSSARSLGGLEGRFDVVACLDLKRNELNVESPCGRLCFVELCWRIAENSDAGASGHNLMEKTKALGGELARELIHPGQIAARMRQAFDQAERNRVTHNREHDRDR